MPVSSVVSSSFRLLFSRPLDMLSHVDEDSDSGFHLLVDLPETSRVEIILPKLGQKLAPTGERLWFVGEWEAVSACVEAFPSRSRIVLRRPRPEQAAAHIEDLQRRGFVVGLQVHDEEEAMAAFRWGAEFLLAAGHESGGYASSKTSFVLLQELLRERRLPVYIRGDLGPLGMAAAAAAGASGGVIDTPAWPIWQETFEAGGLERIRTLHGTDTQVFGRETERSFRGVLLEKGPLEQELQQGEVQARLNGDWSAYDERFRSLLRAARADGDGHLIPLGQGVGIARMLSPDAGYLDRLNAQYEAVLSGIGELKEGYPFREGNLFCQKHGCRYPVVQGPMANVADKAAFAQAVSDGGGAPFHALTLMPPKAIRALLVETRELLGEAPFGVGIIGFAADELLEQQIQVILEEKPAWVTIAGGNPSQARRFEEAGIACFLHAPTAQHLESFARAGATRFIFEGHEAGGHIGRLGSLVQWEEAVRVLEVLVGQGVVVNGVLFAGGIASPEAVAMSAVFAGKLEEIGVSSAVQMGTAYLLTDEIATTGAVSPTYQEIIKRERDTVSFGNTINLPTRCVRSKSPEELLREELKQAADGRLSLSERKLALESMNQGRLRLAAKGIRRNPEWTEGSSIEKYIQVDALQQEMEGAYHAGQGIAVLNFVRTIEQLHRMVTHQGRVVLGATSERVKVEVLDEPPDSAVAVVGMACRVPGASNLDEFWDMMVSRRSGVSEINFEGFDMNRFYRSEAAGGNDGFDPFALNARVAGFISYGGFDSLRFKMPPSLVKYIDFVQLLGMQVADETLRDYSPDLSRIPLENTCVILGNTAGGRFFDGAGLVSMQLRAESMLRRLEAARELDEGTQAALRDQLMEEIRAVSPPVDDPSWFLGHLPCMITGRIANHFRLQGGGMLVDSACGSGLAAIDHAVNGLRSGKYDAALAGGIEMHKGPIEFLGFSALGALSSGECYVYDERSQGFVMGEGAAMVLLKRYRDAVEDGDRIYALIRGVGSSTDGAGRGATKPDVDGQVIAYERAFQDAGLDPRTVSLIEGHGTGTQVGDAAELQSILEFYGRRAGIKPGSCVLGSVKPQIGHLRAAAGVAGFVKVALALHHRTLPPTINSDKRSPEVDWSKFPCRVNQEAEEWKNGSSPRRAAVSSFGFGGTNFHTVLEESPLRQSIAVRSEEAATKTELLVLGGDDRRDLAACVEAAARQIGELQGASNWASAAVDFAEASHGKVQRLALVAEPGEPLQASLDSALQWLRESEEAEVPQPPNMYYQSSFPRDGKVVFLFPGQGSHLPKMGRELAELFDVARAPFEQADQFFAMESDTVLTDLVWSDDGAARNGGIDPLKQTVYAQPALSAVGVASSMLLDLAGIGADMTAGHSLGEFAALYQAGALDMVTLIALVATRGRVMQSVQASHGAMAAVFGPVPEIEEIIAGVDGYVIIANYNCPDQVTLSGEAKAVEQACAHLRTKGLDVIPLPVQIAFHSRHIEGIGSAIEKGLRLTRVMTPRIPVQSNLLGDFYPRGEAFHESFFRLITQHAYSPVHFHQNLESLYRAGGRIFVELSPGTTLTGFVRSTFGDRNHAAFPLMRKGVSEFTQLQIGLAQMAACGKDLNLRRLYANRRDLMATELRVSTTPARRTAIVPPAEAGIERSASAADADLGWMEEVLSKVPEDARSGYWEQRKDYLKSVLREIAAADFAHLPAAAAASGPSARQERQAIPFREHPVVQAIVEVSGYRVDQIKPEHDLEADLGIDSIKVLEVVKILNTIPGFEASQLDHDRSRTTVAQWMEVFEQYLGSAAPEVSRPASVEAEGPPPAESDAVGVEDFVRLVQTWNPEDLPAEELNGESLRGWRIRVLEMPSMSGSAEGWSKELEALGATILEASEGTGDGPDAVLVSVLAGNSGGRGEDPWPLGESQSQLAMQEALALLQETKRQVHSAGPEFRGIWVLTEVGPRFLAKDSSAAWVSGIVLGGLRCLRNEVGGCPMRIVDVFGLSGGEASSAVLAREILYSRPGTEISYHDGQRLVAEWADAPFEEISRELESDRVILAVGGYRGITAAMVEELAKGPSPRILVTGRRPSEDWNVTPAPLPEETIEAELASREEYAASSPVEIREMAQREVYRRECGEMIRTLRSQGVEIDYVKLDLLDRESVAGAVEELKRRYGRLDCVLFGAVELTEQKLENFSLEGYARGVRVRTEGLSNLLAVLADFPPREIINCGTIAAQYGSPGMASYAGGHQASVFMLDHFGARFGCDIRHQIWTGWDRVGLTRFTEHVERFRTRGILCVTREVGKELFRLDYEGSNKGVVAFVGRGEHLEPGANVPTQSRVGEVFDRFEIQGNRFEAVVTIDSVAESWIQDHQVAGETYLAGVSMLELGGLAASQLDLPGRLQRIDSVRFRRPVRFPGNRVRVLGLRGSVVETGPEQHVQVELSSEKSIQADGAEDVNLHMSAIFVFGERQDGGEPTVPVAALSERELQDDVLPVYTSLWAGRYPFIGHKGNFRCMKRVKGLHGAGMRTQVAGEATPWSGSCGNTVLIDGGLQSVALWNLVHGNSISALPASMDSIIFYGDGLEVSESEVRLFSYDHNGKSIRSNLDFVGPNGRLQAQIRGLVSTCIDPPIHFQEARIQVLEDLREPTDTGRLLGMLGFGDRVSMVGMRIPSVRDENPEWISRAAEYFLGQGDLEKADSLADEERLRFLLERLALATAVGGMYGVRLGIEFVTFAADPLGNPVVEQDRLQPGGLSLASTGEIAVAVAAEQPVGLAVVPWREEEAAARAYGQEPEFAMMQREGVEPEAIPGFLLGLKRAVARLAGVDELDTMAMTGIKRQGVGWVAEVSLSSPEGRATSEYRVACGRVPDLPDQVWSVAVRSKVSPGDLVEPAAEDSTGHQPAPTPAATAVGFDEAEIEAKARVMCEIASKLSRRQVNPETHLVAEAGFDSLQMVKLRQRTIESLGLEIPLMSFFHFPVIKNLLQSVLVDDHRLVESQHVESRFRLVYSPLEGKSPMRLFWAQRCGTFHERLKDVEFALYLFPSPWDEKLEFDFKSVENTASAFLEDLKRIQPRGPYLLGGYCFGALVAFEVACRLERAGEEVELLYLLDPTIGRANISSLQKLKLQRNMETVRSLRSPMAVGQWLLHKLKWNSEKLTRGAAFHSYRLWVTLAGSFSADVRSRGMLRYRREFVARLQRNYIIPEYHGNVVLWKSAARDRRYHDFWRGRVKGGLEFRTLDGATHESFIEEDQVNVWSEALLERLAKLRQTEHVSS